MLRALNDSFSLLVDEGVAADSGRVTESSSFIVCQTPKESKSTVFRDLQLIYDFVQITLHLSIGQLVTDDDLSGSVDVIHFRSLQRLEVQKVPIKRVTGLRKLRSQLKEVICNRCLESVQDLILRCGGDNTTGHFWSQLTSANFANNSLQIIDNSLELTPLLQTLNLSHNQLTESSLTALRCLPNLKYLDLSYNRLTSVPILHQDASSRLQEMNLKNNFIESLTEVANLSALAVLDLSGNYIIDQLTLAPLSALASLRYLNLLHNPFAYHPKHRKIAITYLHSNTSTVKFLLNQQPLTKQEKKSTGAVTSYHLLGRSESRNISMNSSVSSLMDTLDIVKSDRIVDSTKKRLRIREITPAESLHVEEEEKEALHKREKNPELSSSFTNRSLAHLETKKQIEELREKHGESWLNTEGSNIVTEVFPAANKDDVIFRKLLMDELQDSGELTLDNFDDQSTPYSSSFGTAGNQSKILNDPSTPLNQTFYETVKEPDLDEFYSARMQDSFHQSDPEENEVEYEVQKLVDVKGEQGTKHWLVISDVSIREKDFETKKYEKWNVEIRFYLKQFCLFQHHKSVGNGNFRQLRASQIQRDLHRV